MVVALDDEAAQTTITLAVRVFEDVEQITAPYVEDDVLEPDAAIRLELCVRRSSQAKYFTALRRALRVPARHTLASAGVCPNEF